METNRSDHEGYEKLNHEIKTQPLQSANKVASQDCDGGRETGRGIDRSQEGRGRREEGVVRGRRKEEKM